jgi:hypothetical protein
MVVAEISIDYLRQRRRLENLQNFSSEDISDCPCRLFFSYFVAVTRNEEFATYLRITAPQ